jgi:hypothetical protein
MRYRAIITVVAPPIMVVRRRRQTAGPSGSTGH